MQASRPSGINRWKSPVGYELQLAAAEPNVLNMIALSVDVDGRIYLAETDRYQDAVFDVVTYGRTGFRRSFVSPGQIAQIF